MRVGVLSIQHESNTFVREKTTLAEFRRDALLTGPAMLDYCRQTQHETGGFCRALDEAGIEMVPLLLALAAPGGPLCDETADALLARLREQLSGAGGLGGLLVAPHGAAVSETHRDFDGHWLALVRELVGPKMPIVGTLDPHANVSSQMVAVTNALVAYRTNPHVDQFATGQTAAQLLTRTLRDDVRLTQALCQPPVVISIDRQATDESPCAPLYEFADRMLDNPHMLSKSIVLGFPYADVEDVGTSMIVVTDGDRALAQRQAGTLAAELVNRRHEFTCQLPSVDDAISRCANANERLCLLDVGDNVGGGAAGDGSLLLRRLHDQAIGPSLVALWDPRAVAGAQEIGIGQRGRLALGGRHAVEQGGPVVAEVEVQWLGDGRFSEKSPVHGGRNAYEMGPSAVVTTDRGVTVLLMTQRVPPFSLGQLRCSQLEPAAYRVLVAKGANAPIAAYREVCDRFIRVDTPGVTCADMTRLAFEYRRRPLFPFESITGDQPAAG